MSFYQDIIFRALTIPSKPAIVQRGTIVTFGQLGRGILAVAAEIRKLKLAPGSICAVINGTPLVEVTMTGALQHLGMVSLYVQHPRLLSELNIPIRAAFVLKGAPEIKCDLPLFEFDPAWLSGPSDPDEAAPQHADALAHVCTSSGTTGKPKAIGFSNNTITRRQLVKHFASSVFPWDRMLCGVPLTTSLGFGWVNFSLASGKTVYLEGSDVIEQLKSIHKNRIQFVVASVKQSAAFAHASQNNGFKFPELQGMALGGGLITSKIASDVTTYFCKNAIALYGSTETGPSAFAPLRNAKNRNGWTGTITPWSKIQIRNEYGDILGVGKEGIIRVTTEGRAYYLDENGQMQKGDGWHYPGDEGIIDSDLSLSITGRTDELINSGGVKISPDAIDEFLQNLDVIVDAASHARATHHGFQEVAIAVVVRAGSDETAIKLDLETKIKTRFGIQSAVYFVQEIPRNSMGKVERKKLGQAQQS